MKIQEDVINLLTKELGVASSSDTDDLSKLERLDINSTELIDRLTRAANFLTEQNVDSEPLILIEASLDTLRNIDTRLIKTTKKLFELEIQQKEQIANLSSDQRRIAEDLNKIIQDINNPKNRNGLSISNSDNAIISKSSELKVSLLSLFAKTLQMISIESRSDLKSLIEDEAQPRLSELNNLKNQLATLTNNTAYKNDIDKLQKKTDVFVNRAFEESDSIAKLRGEIIKNNTRKLKYFSVITKKAPQLAAAINTLAGEIKAVSELNVAASAKRQNQIFQLVVLFAITISVIIMALCFFCYRIIQSAVIVVNQSLGNIAHGTRDLTQRMPDSRISEFDQLADDFNAFVVNIQETVKRVDSSLDNLSSAVDTSRDCSNVVSSASEEQHQQIDIASVATEQLTSSIETVAGHANQASTQALLTKEQAETSLSIVEH